MCGSLAGGCAAALTTPFDVVKTRLMLRTVRVFFFLFFLQFLFDHPLKLTHHLQSANGVPYTGVRNTMMRIVKEEGLAKLFSGIQPRVMWISLGGFIFFGCYEETKKLLQGLHGLP